MPTDPHPTPSEPREPTEAEWAWFAIHGEPGEPGSWSPLSQGALADAPPPPPPAVLRREDGSALLYPGKHNVLIGASGSGKTWLALYAVAEVLRDGGWVLYLDCESDGTTVRHRLLALGVAAGVLNDRFMYVNPPPGRPARDDEGFARLLARRWGLVVIDGVTEAMAGMGLDPNVGTDVVTFYRGMPDRFAEVTGAAVLSIDHPPKPPRDDRAGAGRYAIGSERKLSGATGTVVVVDRVLSPFGVGLRGAMRLAVAKDRAGRVAGTATALKADAGPVWGDFVLTSRTADGPVTATVEIADVGVLTPDGKQKPTWYMERVSDWLSANPDQHPGQNALLDAIAAERQAEGKHFDRNQCRRAVAHLETDGYLEIYNKGQRGRAQPHYLIKPYAAASEGA